MGLNGSILRSVSMVLLLTVYMCCGGKKSRSRCNYREIAGSYRDIILVEIQRLNLTSSLNTSDEKHHCPSGKVRHILRSIYTLTRQFRCHQGEAPEKDLERPVESMERLLAYYCSQDLLVKKGKVCPARRIRGKRRRRLKLMNTIKALVNCWQKFQSVLSQN